MTTTTNTTSPPTQPLSSSPTSSQLLPHSFEKAKEEAELRKYYQDIGQQIWIVCSPILLIIGLLGNVLSILVLSRKAMRKSNAAVYLIVLSVVDVLVLYTGLLRQWVLNMFGVDVRHIGVAFCQIHSWLVYSSLHISVWVLVALTFERLVSVYLPHRVKKHCTLTTSLITLGVIGVAMLALNSHFFYGMGTLRQRVNSTLVVVQRCEPRTPEYSHFISHVWPLIDLCVYSLIPLTVVFVSNISIIVKVCFSHRKARRVQPSTRRTNPGQGQGQGQGQRQGQGQCSSVFHQSRKVSSMTAILVLLNVVLLVTTLPVSVTIIYANFIADSQDSIRLPVLWATTNILQYINHSINFLLYCISGSRFREELRAMFHRKHRVAAITTSQTPKEGGVPLSRLRSLVGGRQHHHHPGRPTGKRKEERAEEEEEEEEGTAPTTGTTATTTTTVASITATRSGNATRCCAPTLPLPCPLAFANVHSPRPSPPPPPPPPPRSSSYQGQGSPSLGTEHPTTETTSLASNGEVKVTQHDLDPDLDPDLGPDLGPDLQQELEEQQEEQQKEEEELESRCT